MPGKSYRALPDMTLPYMTLPVNTPLLPEEIRKHRKRLGLTQAALAKRVGVTRQTAINWEKPGARPPGEDATPKLKKLFGLMPGDEETAKARSALLKAASERTNENLVKLSEVSGYAKAVLSMLRSVTAEQEKVVASLGPWVDLESESEAAPGLPANMQQAIETTKRVAGKQSGRRASGDR